MRSYGQYCGLAKALDHVGDRWSLLIVRELLIAPRRYSQVRMALPGIASNLLADRLRDLTADGVITRDEDGRYELTDFGRELEGTILGLVRWGGRWMREGQREDEFRPEWLAVALKALLPRRRPGRIQIHTAGSIISIAQGVVKVGEISEPDAEVMGPPDAILGVVVGELPASAVRIKGNRKVALAGLQPSKETLRSKESW